MEKRSSANSNAPKNTSEDDRSNTVHEIRNASQHLNSAGTELASELSKFENLDAQRRQGIDFEASGILSDVNKAKKSLDSASKTAEGEQQQTIDKLQNLSEFERSMALLMDSFAEAYTGFVTGYSQMQSGKFNDSIDRLESAQAKIDEVRRRFNTTKANYDAMSDETLKKIGMENESKSLGELNKSVKAFDIIIDGVYYWTKGSQDLKRGKQNYQSGNYKQASQDYADARTHFSKAVTIF
ncbi:MAG: hypothetical protein SXQ77_05120, partial [Halobacteria archaeon]|nr:hypothetical protein [Halobacteria archaeon]